MSHHVYLVNRSVVSVLDWPSLYQSQKLNVIQWFPRSVRSTDFRNIHICPQLSLNQKWFKVLDFGHFEQTWPDLRIVRLIFLYICSAFTIVRSENCVSRIPSISRILLGEMKLFVIGAISHVTRSCDVMILPVKYFVIKRDDNDAANYKNIFKSS